LQRFASLRRGKGAMDRFDECSAKQRNIMGRMRQQSQASLKV
jgi:hypothetical protein